MVKGKSVEVNFIFERETKRTYRFQENAPEGEGVIGTLYVQKSAFDKQPEKVTVTLTAE